MEYCITQRFTAVSRSIEPDDTIEETFSKLKVFLNRVIARAYEDLLKAVCQALLTVTKQDEQGWFRYCVYLPVDTEA